MSRAALDIGALRQRLAGLEGQGWWRGLEALSETVEVQAWLEAEFPEAAPLMDRRHFLRLMGASLAMAGLTACGRPPEQAVPSIHQAESSTPGIANWYASAVVFAGIAQPVLGKTHGGRPTKLEGNPEHPVSRGTCDAFTQAAILQLYDPDRSQAPRFRGRETTWVQVRQALSDQGPELDATQGAGLHILCGASSSPTLARQLRQLQERWPRSRLHHAEPFAQTQALQASQEMFGRPLEARRYLQHAQVLVCLEDDPLGCGPCQTPWQRDWAERRRRAAQGDGVALLFAAQSVPNLTGAAATRRLAIAPSRLPGLTLALCQALGQSLGDPGALTREERAWLRQVVAALKGSPGAGLVCASQHAPAEVQAAAAWLNQQLGHQGRTLDWQRPVLLGHDASGPWESLQQFSQALRSGTVRQVLFLDCNPVYTAPATLELEQALQQVPLRVHAGLYYDETAVHCHWHLPLNHALDGWSDARAADGSSCIVQPLIEPLYATRTVHQVLALLQGRTQDALALVRETWNSVPEASWLQALARGWIEGSAPVEQVPVAGPVSLSAAPTGEGLEAVVRPDPCVWDGRFANLGWLQELPKPISTLTWSNVIGLSPRLAEHLGVGNGDGVEVLLPGERVRGPAWVEPGQADQVIALYAGYGRQHAGRVGNALGYAVRPLQQASVRATLRTDPQHYPLAMTQAHHRLPADEQPPIRTVPRATPQLPGQAIPVSLYSEAEDSGPQWGMVIDLDLCTGCNACVTACQAENNIAVVGASQVALGRSMHWLRIDHYYQGTLEAPRSHFQPLPCMHCEQAPCEPACPVSATVHSRDGLNQMVYNRCIGTRTCASYCPYKVRRFNWLDWNTDVTPSIEAQRNPQVSVRARGVMEKCTYCIQRISAARIENKQQPQAAQVLTACQQTCPSQAIRFGNIADPSSAVSQARGDKRHYRLLEALGTRPRTTYLARIEDLDEEGRDET